MAGSKVRDGAKAPDLLRKPTASGEPALAAVANLSVNCTGRIAEPPSRHPGLAALFKISESSATARVGADPYPPFTHHTVRLACGGGGGLSPHSHYTQI